MTATKMVVVATNSRIYLKKVDDTGPEACAKAIEDQVGRPVDWTVLTVTDDVVIEVL